MPLLSKKARATMAAPGGQSGYLKIKKDKPGDQIRFRIVSPEPLEYWTAWGTEVESGKARPFRFAEQPTQADILSELGANYKQATKWESEEPRPANFCLSTFVFDYESESIMVLELDKTTLIRELDNISNQEDYADLTDWDFIITYKGPNNGWYSVMPAPKKKGMDDQIADAWTAAEEAGADLARLLVGGDPFKG
jgi:hypothetical protein